MKRLFVLVAILGISAGTQLSAGDDAKDNKKKASVSPKAVTVSMDIEIKGQIVKEEKDLVKSKGTKSIIYLICPADNRKYALPQSTVKDDPSDPEMFIGKNVVLKGNTEVSSRNAKVTVITSIKEDK
ncbi:MAG TPA: hypothetical protein DET40_15965 [Lentisphaeria bacterium]|nr:MAG: hypothetical protein A2X45_20280 [Lentisphaerae bacterium GWF2_50_93]HCE45037.1 hypothetical protein [Lentisphaeria bacterium]